MTRVLILTADIGAGHDLPAELLAQGLRSAEPGVEVSIEDGLTAMGRIAERLGRSGAETILRSAWWLFEVQYWLIQTFAPTRRLGAWLLEKVGGRGLLRLIARTRPDVIVSTYPGTTDVLGRLRRRGRLAVPCAAAVTDLAALRFWAHPGMDLHLIIHAESRAEVEAIAGAGADIRHVRGLSRPEFDDPPSPAAARASLGLPADGPIVVVSGGGWGVGDLERATRVVLGCGAFAVCLCGTNGDLRARLERDFGDDPRVRVEGFTTRMCEWLSAADALVHSTAGLTMLEAELCGTWTISYGWGVGHIRVNNAAYRRFGLAAVAQDPAELAAAVRAALAAPRPRPEGVARWPSAAGAVLELADGRLREGPEPARAA
jgi:processive 1,2-diacylglycerol beta-glucosyltransferase